jgi:four helix bundle protein
MIHNQIRTFEQLECWKACRKLRIFVAKEVVPALPKEGRYRGRLGDQILKAARSTTANISEGYGRYHYLDNAKFCSNSRGSCFEVLDHLITAHDEEFIVPEMLSKGRGLVNNAVKLINGYMNYLKRAAKGSSIQEESAEYITKECTAPDNQSPIMDHKASYVAHKAEALRRHFAASWLVCYT